MLSNHISLQSKWTQQEVTFQISYLWCDLGESQSKVIHVPFSFFYLIEILIWRGTFCWKTHLNKSCGSKVMSKSDFPNPTILHNNEWLLELIDTVTIRVSSEDKSLQSSKSKVKPTSTKWLRRKTSKYLYCIDLSSKWALPSINHN